MKQIYNLKFTIFNKMGFTLIELLIVIGILGILATTLFGNFMSSAKKGRDAQRKHDLQQLQRALEMYYSDIGYYPVESSGKISGCPPGTACEWGSLTSTGELVNAVGGTVYMKVIPKDPGTTSYCYTASGTTPTAYQLYAVLENTDDAKIITAKSCGGSAAIYNFGLASANSTP